MILDYNSSNEKFILRVPALERARVPALVNDEGFDFSLPASSPQEAVLFTSESYAAVSFFEQATEAARDQLREIHLRIQQSQAKDHHANFRCPADVELWGFQRAGVAYALGRKHTLIGDQPGLGKTAQAIVFANEIRAKRILVICPASIRLQWAKRIREWTTLRSPYIIHTILHGKRGVHPNANWTIVSYDLASTGAIGQALAAAHYDLLILDEAHYLKTVDARRTRAVFGGGEGRTFEALATRSARILALTGTPLPNRPREAYTLARGLCFDAIDWMSEDSFRERFNPAMEVESKTGKKYIDERTGRRMELQNRLRGNFMVRRDKREVMPQLKMPLYDLIQVSETGAVKAALAAEKLLDIDPENLTGADAQTLGHVAVVRRQMGLAMAPQVADWVDDLIDGGEEKIAVFGHHIEVLNILERRWQKHGVVRIDGSTSMTQRMKHVSTFVNSAHCKVILGNIMSMGVGVDGLQEVCNHCLLAEVSWVPGDNQQAIDRLDRGGQKRSVQADLFVAPGSFAEKILAASLRKGRVLHEVLDRRHG